MLRTGEPLLADDDLHRMLTERGDAEMIGSPSLQWLGVPLKIGDKTIGVLAVQSYTPGVRYGEAEERMLAFVSAQIAMTIERKRAEVALRESEMRLARAQETAHLGSWELDLTNLQNVTENPLWWSDETYRIFGYEPRAVPVSNDLFFKAVPPEDVPRINAAVEGSLQHGLPYFIQHRVIRPDGSERIVEERSTVLRDPAGRPVRMVGTVLDVTERQRLEQQLRQAQKMEAVGRLAGGIAHDFNNLLTAILGSSELLLARLGLDHPDRIEAEEIRNAAMWAADLTRQLLAFSRQQVLDPQVLDLSEVVSDLDKMLRRLIRADVTFRTRFAPDLGAVRADPGQIGQVIMNLVVNACDAMPTGGTLTIETANIEVGAGHEPDQVPAPGRYVVLTVSDTGHGMDAATRAHIFEPFFTTKERGKGTGPGPLDRVRNREAERRIRDDRERDGTRQRLQGLPAAHRHQRRTRGIGHHPRRAARRGRDDPGGRGPGAGAAVDAQDSGNQGLRGTGRRGRAGGAARGRAPPRHHPHPGDRRRDAGHERPGGGAAPHSGTTGHAGALSVRPCGRLDRHPRRARAGAGLPPKTVYAREPGAPGAGAAGCSTRAREWRIASVRKLKRKHILIADDDLVTISMLEGVLKAGGFEISIAADAMQTIMLAVRKPPDAIILDIGMPGGGGYQVLERLKASTNKKLKTVPIIVLTGVTDPQLRGRVLGMGADEFFSKPVAPEKLREALDRLLAPRVDDMAGT